MTPLILAAAAAGWAGLLAMAEAAPGLTPALGEPPPGPGRAVPLPRAVRVSRLALLLLAGAAAGAAVQWWRLALPTTATTLTLAGLLIFMVGDALPRAFGALAPNLATWAIAPARATLVVFRPLLGIVTAVDRLTHRLLPSRRTAAGVLGAAQRDMLMGVASLAETTVADIMTPRLDIAAIEADTGWREVVEHARRSGHSRIPVYRDNLDEIVGVLYAKDFAPGVAATTSRHHEWAELIRPAQFVPESRPLDTQLRDFQRGRTHLAIVVDEFGGTSGLVTLEDVLEEIVGEIHDEYDVDEEPQVEREGDEKFWVDGRLTLDDLSGLLGATFKHDEVSTVGGLVYSELGRVPQPGEELRIDGFRVVVEQVVRRRIRRVYFERLGAVDELEPGGGSGA